MTIPRWEMQLIPNFEPFKAVLHVRRKHKRKHKHKKNERAPFSSACACARVVPVHTWLVLASSRFTRGLCLRLCSRCTRKPAFSMCVACVWMGNCELNELWTSQNSSSGTHSPLAVRCLNHQSELGQSLPVELFGRLQYATNSSKTTRTHRDYFMGSACVRYSRTSLFVDCGGNLILITLRSERVNPLG